MTSVYNLISNATAAEVKKDSVFVYFLIKETEIVYVGQTKELGKRILHHSTTKDFDSYNMIEVKSESANMIESIYIHMLQPKLNSFQNGNSARFASREKKAPIAMHKIIDELVSKEISRHDK